MKGKTSKIGLIIFQFYFPLLAAVLGRSVCKPACKHASLKCMQTQHALFTSPEQLSAQVKACVLQMYLSAFCSSLFQILSHSVSENILRSPLSILFVVAPWESSTVFSFCWREIRQLSFNMHEVMGRSDLLPVFPQQPSCSSEDLTRISLGV